MDASRKRARDADEPEPDAAEPDAVDVASEDDPEERRFMLELEFVQALANPQYLHFLAELKYLQRPDFVAYLDYLQYWQRPEYVRYLVFPHCLFFLRMLQEEQFRMLLQEKGFVDIVCQQQQMHWIKYGNRRIHTGREAEAEGGAEAGEAEAGAGASSATT